MRNAIAVAAALLLATGCAPATRLIIKKSDTKEQPKPTAADATIIVGNIANWHVVNLLDENGKVAGQLTGRSHTVLHHPAGAFKLYAMPEKEARWGDRVEGTLEAGRVYLLQVGQRFGGARVINISERTDKEEWGNRKTYVADLDRVDLDSAQLAGLNTDLGDTKPYLTQIDEIVAGFEADDKKMRTVEAADGEN